MSYKIKGWVAKQKFYNDENNYGIYVVITLDELPYYSERQYKFKVGKPGRCIDVVGNMQMLAEGQEYTFNLDEEINSKYGKQYKVKSVQKEMPISIADSKKFLSALTENTSVIDQLLDLYPNFIQDVVHNSEFIPDFDKIKGLGEVTYQSIKNKILDTYAFSDLITLLSPLGVTITMIRHIAGIEENQTLLKQWIVDNPYRLIGKVPRLTFPKIDAVALQINPSLKRSKMRISQAIQYVLLKISDNGSTVMKRSDLDKECKDILGEDYDIYQEVMNDEVFNPKFLKFFGTSVGLLSNYNKELYVWDKLCLMQNTYNKYTGLLDVKIEHVRDTLGFDISDEQEEAVRAVANNNVIIVSGKAGVGKSSTLKAILSVYDDKKIDIVAFSAKAARRTEEITGVKARTIHSFLHYGIDGFGKNEDNPIESDIVIIDEMSMVNTDLFYYLLKATPLTTKIVMVGDFAQLPPIGAGALFTDLINLENPFKMVYLTKVFRQAAESGITTDGNKIRNGQIPFKEFKSNIVSGVKKDMFYICNNNNISLKNAMIEYYVQLIKSGKTPDDVQIITPRRTGSVISTEKINEEIMNLLINDTVKKSIYKNKVFKLGAKVINTVNDPIKSVFNGETGYVVAIDSEKINENRIDYKTTVRFLDGKEITYSPLDIDNLDLAYCLTIHKMQGSEVPIAIIGIENGHYIMLSRQLLYTAITRAKQKCVVFAQPNAFISACKKSAEFDRHTFWQIDDQFRDFKHYKQVNYEL